MIEIGTKVHVVYRALYENSVRRHFVGEITSAEGAVVCLSGFAFVMDANSRMYVKKPNRRLTVIDLGESGYIVNVLPPEIDVEKVEYRYIADSGLVATDGSDFRLDINEFSMKH